MGDCIVDANVLHGSGYGPSLDSMKCRQILEILDRYDCVILCSHSIWSEWQSHLSKFAALWQARMVASQKISFAEPAPYHQQGISAAILKLPISGRAAAQKDAHLLELAVSGNAIVISCEKVCRALFVRAGHSYAPISGVYWVSPITCPVVHGWFMAPSAPPLNWQLV